MIMDGRGATVKAHLALGGKGADQLLNLTQRLGSAWDGREWDKWFLCPRR